MFVINISGIIAVAMKIRAVRGNGMFVVRDICGIGPPFKKPTNDTSDARGHEVSTVSGSDRVVVHAKAAKTVSLAKRSKARSLRTPNVPEGKEFNSRRQRQQEQRLEDRDQRLDPNHASSLKGSNTSHAFSVKTNHFCCVFFWCAH
jgi:hypothetical protein